MTTATTLHPQIAALVGELRATQKFFNTSSACLEEADSTFAPVDGMLTTAQQILHVASSVEWFVEGAFSPDGFALEEPAEFKAAMAAMTSVEEGRAALNAAFDRAVEILSSKTPEELAEPLPEGPVMGGQPRSAVVGGIVDHTAHHRGALTVYARLRGHTPAMPYI
jgi:uncharacterized damage-inducible protein DinB